MSFQATEFVISLEISSAPQKLLMLCIAYHVDRKTGRWIMSQEELAEEATMSIRQVKHHSAALEADRRLIRHERRDKTGARDVYEYEIVGYAEWMSGQRVSAREIHERARSRGSLEGRPSYFFKISERPSLLRGGTSQFFH